MVRKPAAKRTPDRMLPAEKKKLKGMLVRFMEISGAEMIRATTSDSVSISGKKCIWYEFKLDTPLGPLAVHFTSDENHLHCRFDDVPRALTVMAGSINQYSGKYNEYVFQRCTAKHAFDEILMPHLWRIWIRAAQKIDTLGGNPFARYIRACTWMASFRKWKAAPELVTQMLQMRSAFNSVKSIINAYGKT